MNCAIKTTDLTEGSIWKKMIIFVLPILFSSILQQLYITSDAVIIGVYAGKNALAAIDGICSMLKIPMNFVIGLSAGVSIIISQAFGAGDGENVKKTSNTAIILSFFIGPVLSAAGIVFAPLALKLLQIPQEIYYESLSYIRIYFVGITASMIYSVGAGILRAVGNSKTPSYILIVANLINVLLDIVFVALLRLGAVGASLATVFSQLISCLLILFFLLRAKGYYKLDLLNLNLHYQQLKNICSIGLPIGIQSTIYPFANMIIQSNINFFGTDSIAAWAVCGKLDFLIWLVIDSFCISVSTFAAQNYGAKKYLRVRNSVNAAMALTGLVILIISLILYFWNIPLSYLFVKDEKVVEISSGIIRKFSFLYLTYIPGGIIPGAIRGTGETVKPMIMTLVGTYITRILWILFILPMQSELMTLLAVYPVSWLTTSFIFVVYYKLNFLKSMQ